MSSINHVVLLGNLGSDPKLFAGREGVAVARFRMATDAFRGGELVPTWHRVVVFGRLALQCERALAKGSRVCVEGRIDYSTYTGEDGTTRYYTDVIAQRVHFLSPSKAAVAANADAESGAAQAAA